jgi:5-methylcytosine-specific restriction endonuclease McrA
MSALRGARWQPKFKVIDRAFIEKGINPETGKPCKLHKCEECKELFPKGKMKADHVNPVIPIDNDWASNPDSFLDYNWNEVMRRLWIEEGNSWNVICDTCHLVKSNEERKMRNETKKSNM